MQHYFMLLALDVANERVQEAARYRLGRRVDRRTPSRLRRILEVLAGRIRVTAAAGPQPGRRPA